MFYGNDDPLPYFRNYKMGAYIASHQSAVNREYKAAQQKLTDQ
jgi:hypothetical protein